jgi:Fe-S-cluster-containing hydrogenase component 2
MDVCPTDALRIVNSDGIERTIKEKRYQSAIGLALLRGSK